MFSLADYFVQLLDLEGVVSPENCRLVKYDEFHDNIEESIQEETGKTMRDYLGGVKSSYKFDLLMEIQRPNQKFQVYESGGKVQ